MLDIKTIRNNPDLVKQAVKNRNGNLDAVIDELLEIDAERLKLTSQVESLRAEQNAASKQIYTGRFQAFFGFLHLLGRGNPFFSSAVLSTQKHILCAAISMIRYPLNALTMRER